MFKLMLLLTIFLVGCQVAPTREELMRADYGDRVLYTECEEFVNKYISSTLFDPYSAKFDSFKCRSGWARSGLLAGNKIMYGYVYSGNVNAKNKFGGYVGAQKFCGILRRNGGNIKVMAHKIGNNLCSNSR